MPVFHCAWDTYPTLKMPLTGSGGDSTHTTPNGRAANAALTGKVKSVDLGARMDRCASINDRIVATGGRATGFDYMRLTLAILVVVWHSVATSYGKAAAAQIMESPARALVALILPMFFALSGFLVSGSLERSKTLFVFLGLRVIRIFPALCVEVFISALLLGPIFTQFALSSYFADPTFHRYFFNIIGHIQYALPGVFVSNPLPNVVNGQLWTVPYELECYVVLAAIAALGATRNKRLFLAGLLVLIGYTLVKQAMFTNNEIAIANRTVPGGALVASFLTGVSIFAFREELPWSKTLGIFSILLSVLLLSIPYGDAFATIPIAYVTIYLGLMNPRKISLLKGADYSYGIFLYGFAIQQAVSASGDWTHTWWLNCLIVLPISCLIAAFSWHYIEKPALGWRKQLNQAEPLWIGFCERLKNGSSPNSVN